MPARIVIVDDHQIMRDGLRRLLANHSDLEVVGEGADSETALKLVAELRPDLVLLDLDLPGEGGHAVMRKLVDEYPEMKVLIVTGHIEPRYARDALDAGAAGFLLKTTASDQVLAAVRMVLSGQIYLSAETTAALVRLPAGSSRSPYGRPAFSEREMEVLRLIVDGLRNKEIAQRLNIGIKSVETYRSRLMKKSGCASPAELTRYAIREGLAKA